MSSLKASLSSHNLDYNFAARITHEKKGSGSEIALLGNPHVYRHERHKTGFPMKILITLPPIRHFINVLRFMLAASHPKHSFLSPDEASNPNYDDRMKGKTPEEYYFLASLYLFYLIYPEYKMILLQKI